ncbi:MAG: response regulator [Verrucomicrobia bacterium]|nr:response regulator [Verrucomicrobiota bacterium]
MALDETRARTMAEQKTILIIDDDPDVLEGMRLPLEVGGYNVVVATSGEEGLAKVLECAPNLVILDVMMFTPTEGFHVAHTLRSDHPDSPYAKYRTVPILIVAATHQVTSLRPHLEGDEGVLPADDFVETPVDPKALLTKIGRLLGAR